jgi:hypothetical protein
VVAVSVEGDVLPSRRLADGIREQLAQASAGLVRADDLQLVRVVREGVTGARRSRYAHKHRHAHDHDHDHEHEEEHDEEKEDATSASDEPAVTNTTSASTPPRLNPLAGLSEDALALVALTRADLVDEIQEALAQGRPAPPPECLLTRLLRRHPALRPPRATAGGDGLLHAHDAEHDLHDLDTVTTFVFRLPRLEDEFSLLTAGNYEHGRSGRPDLVWHTLATNAATGGLLKRLYTLRAAELKPRLADVQRGLRRKQKLLRSRSPVSVMSAEVLYRARTEGRPAEELVAEITRERRETLRDVGRRLAHARSEAQSLLYLPEKSAVAMSMADGVVTVDTNHIRVSVGMEALPASCYDGQLSAGEADVDCGGPCEACRADRACAQGDDCVSGDCDKSRCRPLAVSGGAGVRVQGLLLVLVGAAMLSLV